MVLLRLSYEANKTLKGHKLLFLDRGPIPDSFVAHLRNKFPDLEVAWPRRALASPHGSSNVDWEDATIILTLSTLPEVDQVPKLQYVQLQSAGANHVFDKPIFRDTDISFCTANGVHGPQISEWVVCTFLAFQHSIPKYLDFQRNATWNRGDASVDDAVGQRVGILGYGSIGRQVARLSKAMGMDVHAYTLHARDTPSSRRDDSYAPPGLGDPEGQFPSQWFSGDSTEDLHKFLGSGLDLLVVSLPLTDKTRKLISKPELEVLSKKKTFVSNIARGPIIDTDALIDALEGGVIRGAALDVTEPEPLPDGHRLWKTKNLMITPHVSGGSSSYGNRVLAILEENLTRLSDGRPLMNQVNKKEGY